MPQFVKEMTEKYGAYKTKGDFCRFQLTTNNVEKGSWFMANSGCIIEEVGLRCYNRDGPAEKKLQEEVRVGCVENLEEVD